MRQVTLRGIFDRGGSDRAAGDRTWDDGARQRRFGEVVLPNLGDALALARWLTASRHDAEDVVQEACIRALAAIGTYDGRGARPWFLAIVRNTAFTWLGKNRPKDLVAMADISDIELADPATVAEPADPETALLEKLDQASVEAAIARLAPPYREIVVLRDINDLSYKEIAAMLAVPIGTVMSRLARGRKALAADLGRKPL